MNSRPLIFLICHGIMSNEATDDHETAMNCTITLELLKMGDSCTHVTVFLQIHCCGVQRPDNKNCVNVQKDIRKAKDSNSQS